jgi:hypothetical protein
MEIVRTYEQELRYIERVATRVVLLFLRTRGSTARRISHDLNRDPLGRRPERSTSNRLCSSPVSPESPRGDLDRTARGEAELKILW